MPSKNKCKQVHGDHAGTLLSKLGKMGTVSGMHGQLAPHITDKAKGVEINTSCFMSIKRSFFHDILPLVINGKHITFNTGLFIILYIIST